MNLNNRRLAMLHEIGVGPIWIKRHADMRTLPPRDSTGVKEASSASASENLTSSHSAWSDEIPHPIIYSAQSINTTVPVSEMNWIQLKGAVSNCVKCNLCEKRKNTVFGVGDENAKWLFVGEGPGRGEDAIGEPFVGPAGKLLDNMLLSIGIKRGENAYIANIVKCRPTDDSGKDRPPTAMESDACMPYLERQIGLIQPDVIVALGKTAALALLKCDPTTPVSAMRGTVHRYADVPLIVTYHPAYLLRSPADKRKTWVDLCMAMEVFGKRSNAARTAGE